MNDDKTAIWDIVGLATSIGEAKRMLPGGEPYAVVPDNFHVEDLSRFMETPNRARGTVALYDVASFVAYINVRKSWSASAVYGFCNPQQGVGYCAVLNDVEGDDCEPDWRDWRAVYLARMAGMDQSERLAQVAAGFRGIHRREQRGHFRACC
jgi:uncharacterized protein YfdQ (DUF2303 family)